MTPLISIHTATYNRAYILERAYKSLLAQTCFNFEWIISDDSSDDNTEELVHQWQKEVSHFNIIYEKVPHGGKCRAVNSGMQKARGKYFFILDSDDYLTPDAVQTIKESIPQVDNDDSFVGVGFVILTKNGLPVKGVWPSVNNKGYIDCTNLQRNLYNLDADMREAYKLNILKKYPFPSWPGEIFAPEQLSLDAIAMDGYKLRWFNKGIYICEYQPDGLTKGAWNLLRSNKMGYAMLANQQLLYRKGFINLYKSAAEHIALSILGKNPKYILKTNKWWLTLIALPYALPLTIRRAMQFRKDTPN